jgi:PAS domain-containing protein
MRKMCSWCKTGMGTVPSEFCSDADITYGICDECLNMHFGPRQVRFLDFIDSLNAAVVVIDETGSVNSANKKARELLNKELQYIEGFKGGDVFECAFAKLPGGCGETIHCDGCSIRNTVMDTFQTGKSHLKTPAFLFRGFPDNNNEIRFLISTEKVKDIVLLRIDEIGSNQESQLAVPAK